MKEELKQLGLTDNESAIFEFLLSSPNSTTGPIIKKTGIASSRVYASLESLKEKGLVTYNIQKDGTHYSSASPQIFLDKEEQRKKQIEKIIPLLESVNETGNKTETAVYEGFEGFKTAFRKIIEECPENGTIKIIGFGEQEFAFDSLRTFLQNISLKSAEKKQKLKMLLDEGNPQTVDRKKEKHTTVRFLPKGYVSPCAMDILEDSVYIFLWDKEPYCFMIKNEKIAKSFQQYFEVLWTISKEK